MLIRIKFTKEGTMKFIGHLDLIRNFQRVFKKAEFPIAFSEGFNPHPIMSIGAPLSVGITSEAEYLDAKVTEDIDINYQIENLNNHTPEGVNIINIIVLPEKAKSAMALIDAAKYKIDIKNIIINDDMINNLMSKDKIIVQKKNKKNVIKDIDIKPGILNVAMASENTLLLLIATGSRMNIKPQVVLESLCKVNNMEYNKFDYKIHRQEIYYISNNKFLPLDKISQEC
ncbi:radical SAM protein [Vallitalea longa]|uniref:Radical SAM protein n=1 Tax=Vallitalea longa TaxID=2936439 RepID=A0A9W6DEY2_9FIRM|nr:TIGR03936 family radical SAM-associated protein [Vallitalea longa]GKX30000.1 radical SAM protein [Vallitalea longa]